MCSVLDSCLPALHQVQIEILATPRARLAHWTDLLPGAQVDLTIRVSACEVPGVVQQLQGVRLAALDLSCLRRRSHTTGADLMDAMKPLLAQCSMQRLELRLDDTWQDGTRLRQHPHGAAALCSRCG